MFENDPKKKKYLLFTAGGLALSFVLYRVSFPLMNGLERYFLARVAEREERSNLARGINDATIVEAEKLKKTVLNMRIHTIGTLRANASVALHSEVPGAIKEIKFKEGGKVEKGRLLLKFDDSELQAQLRGALAVVSVTTEEFKRKEKLLKDGSESKSNYEKAKAEMEKSLAEVERVKASISKTEIRAPFDGTVGIINLSSGAYVHPNQELVTIVDYTPMKIDFKIPSHNINDVGVGQHFEFEIEACKGGVFTGEVEAVDSKADESNSSIQLRGIINEDSEYLKPGLFAKVALTINEKGDAFTVDESALDRVGDIDIVWVINRGRAKRVAVATGARESGRVEVHGNGLKEGDVVVTAGQMKLTESALVKVSNINDDEKVGSEKSLFDNNLPSEASMKKINLKEEKKKEEEKKVEKKVEKKENSQNIVKEEVKNRAPFFSKIKRMFGGVLPQKKNNKTNNDNLKNDSLNSTEPSKKQ